MGRFPCDGTKLFPIEIENVITWCNLVATREIQAGHWEKLSHCTCCSEKLWNPFLCSFQDSWTKLAELLWGWWLSCFRQLAELDDPGRLLPPNTSNTQWALHTYKGQAGCLEATKGTQSVEVSEVQRYLNLLLICETFGIMNLSLTRSLKLVLIFFKESKWSINFVSLIKL